MFNVSVVITYYNKDKLLEMAIESVYSQINDEDEIIVVNDCSTSELSKTTFQNMQEKYSGKILFLDTPSNSGASFAKDYNIKHSHNEVIILLDADDTLPSDAICNIKRKFNSDKKIALVYGNYIKRDVENQIESIVDCSEISVNGLLNPYKLATNWILLGTSPFKKEVYLEIGGFDKLYPKTDDVDFQRRLIVNRYKCAYIDNIIYIWNRSLSDNNSNHSREDSLFSIMRSFEFYYRYLSGYRFLKFMLKRFLISLLLKFRVIK